MDQASKAPKNFNLIAFTFKDLKNNKSLISSKLEICCEDRSIHLPTKVKKISCLSQVQRRQNQRVFFCKRIEIEIVLIIHQYKFIFANHISFQLFDFLQWGNFVFTNYLVPRPLQKLRGDSKTPCVSIEGVKHPTTSVQRQSFVLVKS